MDNDEVPDLSPNVTTCIVGGGNSAHILIPFLSEGGHRVHLLTRRPGDWQDVVSCEITDGFTGEVSKTHFGRIARKSSNPEDVIPEADVIVLCMPVCRYRLALNKIAPFVNRKKKNVFVGTIYGQAGFDWMARQELTEGQGLKNVVSFATGEIPWICRALEYGKAGANYGGKDLNLVAVEPPDKFDKLNEMFLKDMSLRPLGRGVCKQTCFLSLTMSVDNQIIHPARCYGVWLNSNDGQWASEADVPYFYRDFDKRSADILKGLDDDYTAVRTAIRKRFPDLDLKYMLNYLDFEHLHHPDEGHESIIDSFRNSAQLASIKTPTVPGPNGTRLLNINFRFFEDDIAYGLLLAKWIGEQLNVKTPSIDQLLTWAQNLRGEHFLNDDGTIDKDFCLKSRYMSGIPESYGINDVSGIV
jgi:hypothetical protein